MKDKIVTFLRDCVRLLYWVFFKPTALRAHINRIAPGYEERLLKADRTLGGRASVNLRELRENPALRAFALKALFVIIVAPFVLYGATGLAITAFGGDFNWQRSWSGVAVAGAVAGGVAGGVAFGVAGGVAGGVAVGVGALRLIFYVFEVWPAILAYRRAKRGDTPEHELIHSPVYLDDLLVLPQPFLSSLLLRVARNDLDAGLRHLGRVASNPFQRWATQKAMRALLEQDRIPFFFKLDRLLSDPAEYVRTGGNWVEEERAEDRYFTTKLLLAELAGIAPIPRKRDQFLGDRFARWATLWLRMRGQSPYASPARAYCDLLNAAAEWSNDEKEVDDDLDGVFSAADQSLAPLANLREERHGEEFFQSMQLAIEARHCEGLRHVAKLRDEFNPLFEIDDPLRPQIVTVFRRLRDAAIDAASFLTAAHEITRRDALLSAQSVLEEARQLADDVYEPERSLLLAAIEHWRRMFAVEGGRVAARIEAEELPNPYVAGRPIYPSNGKLFAGRRDEFRAIEEKLQTGVGLVIYGQRRIGKSSILLHLRERLPHHLLPVYLNLQSLIANTTGGFLWAVGNEAVKELRGKLPAAPALPPIEEFVREPYLSFNRLLEEIERQLQGEQRVLLRFDEFEELEQRVRAGRIEKEIFAYLRGITQTGRRFAMLFAGLHTLEQMTREYWNPFFQSVQTIRIGYLGELDARQLITDPIDQFPLAYDEEAINRIAEVTNAHPYLAQSVCHNLVNRLNDPLYRSFKQWRATAEDVDAVLERTLESSGYYFDDYVWGWSNQDERLALIAEAGDEANFAVVEKHLGREAALKATQSLVSRDLITERTERDDLIFHFRIPLSRMWVRRTKSSARILLERDIE